MADTFESQAKGLTSPGDRHYAVTPGAGDLPFKPRALYVQAAGTVTIQDDLGISIVYNVLAGQILPFRGLKVTAVGSGASVVAWY